MAIETKRTADHRPQIVQAAGAATTLAAFGLVFVLGKHGENIMGWYANWFLPVGALLVGAVAASGYAIAGWLTGLKMTTRLAWSIVGQLVLSYFIAQYESYRVTGAAAAGLGFFEWFDLSTQAFSFSSRNGQPGDPMGAVGYVFRALEIAGFVLGGVLVPLGLKAKPYCEPCRTYKRTSTLAVIPGGLHPPPKEGELYGDLGQASVLAIYDAAAAGDRDKVRTLIDERGPMAKARATRKLGTWTTLALSRCPRCAQADMTSRVTENQGRNQFRFLDLPSCALDGERVRELFDDRARPGA